MNHTNENRENHKSRISFGHEKALGKIGFILTFIAFSMAVLTPWIAESIDASAEKAAKELSQKEEEAKEDKSFSIGFGKFKLTVGDGEEKPKEKKKNAPPWLGTTSLIIIIMSLAGIAAGTLALMNPEARILGGSAIMFGLTAIVIQYLMVAFVVIVGLILIFAILSTLGVTF